MPLLIAVLALLLAGAILMALELLRPVKADEGSLDLDELRRAYAARDPYAPMARLLSDDAQDYVRRQPGSSESAQRKAAQEAPQGLAALRQADGPRLQSDVEAV